MLRPSPSDHGESNVPWCRLRHPSVGRSTVFWVMLHPHLLPSTASPQVSTGNLIIKAFLWVLLDRRAFSPFLHSWASTGFRGVLLGHHLQLQATLGLTAISNVKVHGAVVNVGGLKSPHSYPPRPPPPRAHSRLLNSPSRGQPCFSCVAWASPGQIGGSDTLLALGLMNFGGRPPPAGLQCYLPLPWPLYGVLITPLLLGGGP